MNVKDIKLCGWKEPCFEEGKCWGHLEGVMCQHLTEKCIEGAIQSICHKDNSQVKMYTTHSEYVEQLTNEQKQTKMSQIREMYKDLPKKDLDFIVSYKYGGKTADEWLDEIKRVQGYDGNGNPKWYKFLSLAEDTTTSAKLMLMDNDGTKIR